ncbi:MAG: DUF4145 domain-containing protein [Armatimonadota bacterium]
MLAECKQCGAIVDAKVHGEHNEFDFDGDLLGRYILVSCPACDSTILVYQDAFHASEDNYAWGNTYRLYPSRDRVANLAWPEEIGDIYSEAVVCYEHAAYTASAVMCRKVIEGMCDKHGYGKGPLENSLSKMKADEVIDTRLFEWADALRLLGNEAAHGISRKFSKIDAGDILDFTEAILDYVFTFREKFDRFKLRQSKP